MTYTKVGKFAKLAGIKHHKDSDEIFTYEEFNFMQERKEARQSVDIALVKLWICLRELSDFGESALTDIDADVFSAITKHSAVQSRLKTNR